MESNRFDENIKQTIWQNLKDNIWVDSSDIEVIVDHGFVYLKGKVTDRKQKKEAYSCAVQVKNVKAVINDLSLRDDRGLIGDMSIKANLI